MIIRKKTRHLSKKYVQKKLINRLRRLFVVFLVLLTIIGYETFSGLINPFLSLAGVMIGYVIGKFAGKFANVHWHSDTNKVVAKLNKTGVAVLLVYLGFSISRRWIFGHWLHGTSLSAFSVCIAGGAMTGRILSIRKQIRVILREKGLL